MNDDITKMLQSALWPEARQNLANDIMAKIEMEPVFPIWQLPTGALARFGLAFAFIACLIAGYLCALDRDAAASTRTAVATPYGQRVGLSYLI